MFTPYRPMRSKTLINKLSSIKRVKNEFKRMGKVYEYISQHKNADVVSQSANDFVVNIDGFNHEFLL